jgi:superoxide dismutase
MGDNKFDAFEAIKKIKDPAQPMLRPWEQDEVIKVLGIEFIREHADKFDAFYVLKNKKLNKEDLLFFLNRSQKSEDFMMAALSQELDEETMHHYAHMFPWTVLCTTQKMSDEFIIKHLDWVEQAYLPYHQNLRPETVDRLSDVNWMALSARFPLSEQFILEYAHKLDKHELKQNDRIEMTEKVRLLLELS